MSAQPSPTGARQIIWPSVVTVISAAILIGAEVFGAAFAGGWALAILFGLDDTGAHILQAVLFAIGVFIMVAFIRAAQRVEPFTRRALSRLRNKAARRLREIAHASLKKLNICSRSTPLARAECDNVDTRWGNLSPAQKKCCEADSKPLFALLPNFARACGRVSVGRYPDKRPDSRQGMKNRGSLKSD